MEELTKQKSLRATVRGLEPGQSAAFPIERVATVRTEASIASLVNECRITTSINRADRTVVATRQE